MAYNKLNLVKGQVFTAEHLKHIENGIQEAHDMIKSPHMLIMVDGGTFTRGEVMEVEADKTLEEILECVNTGVEPIVCVAGMAFLRATLVGDDYSSITFNAIVGNVDEQLMVTVEIKGSGATLLIMPLSGGTGGTAITMYLLSNGEGYVALSDETFDDLRSAILTGSKVYLTTDTSVDRPLYLVNYCSATEASASVIVGEEIRIINIGSNGAGTMKTYKLPSYEQVTE